MGDIVGEGVAEGLSHEVPVFDAVGTVRAKVEAVEDVHRLVADRIAPRGVPATAIRCGLFDRDLRRVGSQVGRGEQATVLAYLALDRVRHPPRVEAGGAVRGDLPKHQGELRRIEDVRQPGRAPATQEERLGNGRRRNLLEPLDDGEDEAPRDWDAGLGCLDRRAENLSER